MIKLIKSTFYNEAETKDKLTDFIKEAKQLSFGPECEKFEKNFAAYQGRKFSVFFNSGSSANLALIQALINLELLPPGAAVGFSALTWSTNVMPLIQLGLQPVPVDVELDTLNVSSQKLLETIKTTPLKALFLTNVLGFCDDIDKIKRVCREKKILLIEDNCESLGSIYRGKKLGNFGLASTFSFFVGHHLSTIEGGAVCTDNKDLAQALRLVRAHGWDRQLSKPEQDKIRHAHGVKHSFYANYTFYQLGYNLRPTEINGFLGNSELKYAHRITKKRNSNFLKFAKHIYRQTDKYLPIRFDHLEFVSNFAVPVVCRSAEVQRELVEKCANQLEIRPIIGGDLTRQPFFKKHLINNKAEEKTNAHFIHKYGLYFPNNPQLDDDEINTIIKIFS